MAKQKLQTEPFDAADYLTCDEARAAYLEDALDEGDPAEVAAALGVIARAHGMSAIARDTGLGRESLYKSLRAEGNPSLSTFLAVIKALGLRLTVVPAAS